MATSTTTIIIAETITITLILIVVVVVVVVVVLVGPSSSSSQGSPSWLATSVAIWTQAFGFSTLFLDRFLSQSFLNPASIIRPSSLSQFDALLRLRQMGAESLVGAC